jgi:hypothetical protein
LLAQNLYLPEKALAHLPASNSNVLDALNYFEQAIEENLVVIARKKKEVQQKQNKLKILTGCNGHNHGIESHSHTAHAPPLGPTEPALTSTTTVAATTTTTTVEAATASTSTQVE